MTQANRILSLSILDLGLRKSCTFWIDLELGGRGRNRPPNIQFEKQEDGQQREKDEADV